MQKILKKKIYRYPNNDIEIKEVLYTGDEKFKDGIKYNMAYLQHDANSDRHVRLFGIDNSHGPAHIHRDEKIEPVDYDWKIALSKFEEMVMAHIRKEGMK
jgi:hypothetical protein